MKARERSFNWLWVKEIADKDPEARALIKFSYEVKDEPHKFSSRSKIQEWMDRNDAPAGFYKILKELETKWHNQKFFARQGV